MSLFNYSKLLESSYRGIFTNPAALSSIPANNGQFAVVLSTNSFWVYNSNSGGWVNSGGSGAAGTVTSVSIVSANGISGTVANPNTNPAITLSLGNITPTSVAATGAVSGSNLSGTNTGDETNATIKAKLGAATALNDGYLTSADWNTFNNKQNALTNPVTGQATSVDGEVALFSGTTGRVIKRATGSGLAKITSGVLGTAIAGTDYQAPLVNPVTGTGAAGQIAEFNGTTSITGVTQNSAFNRAFETSSANILMDGVASVGTLNTLPRADHTHPSDTSKLGTALPSGNIFVGNASGVATGVAMAGDATISNTGTLTIEDNAITTNKIANNQVTAAKIANDTITTTQISPTAGIVGTQLANATVTGAQIASDVNLTGNPTTTTQALSDNSTKIATTAFVQAGLALKQSTLGFVTVGPVGADYTSVQAAALAGKNSIIVIGDTTEVAQIVLNIDTSIIVESGVFWTVAPINAAIFITANITLLIETRGTGAIVYSPTAGNVAMIVANSGVFYDLYRNSCILEFSGSTASSTYLTPASAGAPEIVISSGVTQILLPNGIGGLTYNSNWSFIVNENALIIFYGGGSNSHLCLVTNTGRFANIMFSSVFGIFSFVLDIMNIDDSNGSSVAIDGILLRANSPLYASVSGTIFSILSSNADFYLKLNRSFSQIFNTNLRGGVLDLNNKTNFFGFNIRARTAINSTGVGNVFQNCVFNTPPTRAIGESESETASGNSMGRVVEVCSNLTLSAESGEFVVVKEGNLALCLPSMPAEGTIKKLKLVAEGELKIEGNGAKIDGLDALVLKAKYDSATLVYSSGLNEWFVN